MFQEIYVAVGVVLFMYYLATKTKKKATVPKGLEMPKLKRQLTLGKIYSILEPPELDTTDPFSPVLEYKPMDLDDPMDTESSSSDYIMKTHFT